MTKKAHITLASHIANRIGLQGKKYRKFIFYSGNIWPDVSIMFLIKRHYITNTFRHLERRINWLNNRKERLPKEKLLKGRYLLHLGKVNHFIADYFTLPHNITFEGVKAHLVYERLLLQSLSEVTESGEVEEVGSIETKNCETIDTYGAKTHYSLPDESANTYYSRDDYHRIGELIRKVKKDSDTLSILKFIIASHYEYLMKVKEAILLDCPSNKKAKTLVDLDSRYIVSVCTEAIQGIVSTN
ncbi:MAG: zinc dependent phospholipase C family protein [Clostridiaceae bacterium]|jgi:hypothetical protein|nr:zinc dependent phospholipase C family protein [Clostridiaceae bacterium]